MWRFTEKILNGKLHFLYSVNYGNSLLKKGFFFLVFNGSSHLWFKGRNFFQIWIMNFQLLGLYKIYTTGYINSCFLPYLSKVKYLKIKTIDHTSTNFV